MKNLSFFNYILILTTSFTVIFSGCNKDDSGDSPAPVDEPKAGTVAVRIENIFKSNAGTEQKLMLSTATGTNTPDGQPKYVNANGDSITVTSVRYWVSNVSLIKEDGNEYKIPDSYFIIQKWGTLTDETFDLAGVPAGTYTGMKFYIGVDSAANGYISSGIGELIVGIGMNWNWNAGYIFSKTEGQYKKEDGTWAAYAYHTGKLGNSVYKPESPILVPFNEKVVINGNHPSVHLKANVNAVFGTPGIPGSTVLDVKTLNAVHGGSDQLKIADNWRSGMFVCDHIHAH